MADTEYTSTDNDEKVPAGRLGTDSEETTDVATPGNAQEEEAAKDHPRRGSA